MTIERAADLLPPLQREVLLLVRKRRGDEAAQLYLDILSRRDSIEEADRVATTWRRWVTQAETPRSN